MIFQNKFSVQFCKFANWCQQENYLIIKSLTCLTEQAGKKASKTSLPAGLPAGGGQGRACKVLNPDS